MAESLYIKNPNILAAPDYVAKAMPLVFGLRKTILAGTPVDADGAIANDGTAIGIVLFNVHKELGGVGQVLISGYVDTAIAKSNSNVTLSRDAKLAMKNINFTGDVGGDGLVPSTQDVEDENSVLGIDEATGKPMWKSIGDGLVPSTQDVEDENSVLSVDEATGKPAWKGVGNFIFPETGIKLRSATEESEKVFLITVDDDGELTATEYVEPTDETAPPEEE